MLNVPLNSGGDAPPMAFPATGSDPFYQRGLALSASGRHHEAIENFERALAATPDDTRVLFALGNTARALGLDAPAEQFYRRVLAADPARIEALVNLANLLRARGQAGAAIALLAQPLSQTPGQPELWLTMGSALRERGETEKAKQHFREALALRPDYAPALGNLADLLADDGEVDEALGLYDRAIRADGQNPQLKLNRAVLHLLAGNLKQGWQDYEARLKIAGKAPRYQHGLPRWSGAPLRRARLLVTAEQGVGDQIMFASLIPQLSDRAQKDGGAVVLECEPRLVPLFRRSFPKVAVRPQQLESRGGVTHALYGWLKAAGGAGAAVEMGSLPKYLRKTLADFPAPHTYLVADAQERAHWRHVLSHGGAAPYIGICWRSGKTNGLRGLQYAPLGQWADFLKTLPGTVVNAQYDAAEDELQKLEELSGRTILRPQALDQKQELDRTAALFSELDAVISAPTAVSWLAAAAGTAVFKVLYDTSWTSFGQDHEPLAPAAHCIRPRKAGDWPSAFAAAGSALEQHFTAQINN